MKAPLFILCPGRSFSSVVCAMIGQHPDCYGLPELDLFLADTLGDAAYLRSWRPTNRTYDGIKRDMVPGLKRVIAQLHFGAQTEETIDQAAQWIDRNRLKSPIEVRAHIQELVGDRILVDKSPSNVVQPDVLNAILKAYPDANYLQLLRHPRPRGISQRKAIEANRLHSMGSRMFLPMDYEAKWTDTHRLIDQIARQLPAGQIMRLRGEDFLMNLDLYLPQICEWLDIRQDADAIAMMLRPEDSPYSSIGPDNAKYGANPGYLASPTLDRERLESMTIPTLEAPMEWSEKGAHFSQATRALANFYGYR